MKKKYAIVNDNKVTLTNKSSCSIWERCIENPKIKIINSLLQLSGDEIIYNFNHYDRYYMADVEKSSIVKGWFGKLKVKEGWITMKKREPIKLTISPFILEE